MGVGVYQNYDDYVGCRFSGVNGKKTYTISKKIKSGGEGGVFCIANDDNLVAKIYSPATLGDAALRNNKAEKIGVMLKYPVRKTRSSTGHCLIAWPIDILYSDGKFFGYVMPKVYSSNDLNVAMNDEMCLAHYPSSNWKTKFAFAHNLAFTVKLVHDAGHVIGDMNPENLLISDEGAVTVIDTDSFSIFDPNTGKNYPCVVGVEEYLAPEIQMKGRAAVAGRRFTKETDYFALAVNIFRLLMGGYHPFTCSAKDSGKSVGQTPFQTYIAEGTCPFVSKINGYELPPGAPTLSDMPPNIAALFKRVFGYTAATAIANIKVRPTAEEWIGALLAEYSNNNSFAVCRKNKSHVYYRGCSKCTWCAAQDRQEKANQAALANLRAKQNQYVNNSGYSQASSKPIILPNLSRGANPSSSSTSTYAYTTTQTNTQTTSRSALPLWIVYMVCGVLSGILDLYILLKFDKVREILSDIGIDGDNEKALPVIFAILGLIVGGVVALIFSSSYRYSAKRALYYGITFLIPLVLPLIFVVIVLAISLLGLLLELALGLVVLYFIASYVCGCCSS